MAITNVPGARPGGNPPDIQDVLGLREATICVRAEPELRAVNLVIDGEDEHVDVVLSLGAAIVVIDRMAKAIQQLLEGWQ